MSQKYHSVVDSAKSAKNIMSVFLQIFSAKHLNILSNSIAGFILEECQIKLKRSMKTKISNS